MIRVAAAPSGSIEAVAELFAAVAADAVRARGRFSVVLAGGRTPEPLYRLLAGPPLSRTLPWPQTHVFWGDERCVPADDPRSNQGMATRALLDHVPVPPGQIHPVPCDSDPETAALAYAEIVRAFGRGTVPRFDLVLLGMGADGHTASLFPGEDAVAERERLAVVARGPRDGPWRVTLTLPVLCAAGTVAFLVAGADKAEALARALRGPGEGAPPAALVQPQEGRLVWFADAAAAALLTEDGRPETPP